MLKHPGEPTLPKMTKTFVLPIGSTITDLNIQPQETKTQKIDGAILPGSQPIIGDQTTISSDHPSKEIYEQDLLYPPTPYTVNKCVGLKDNQHVLFYTVQYYPIRYNPVQNMITHSESFDITLEYIAPTNPVNAKTNNEKDLLVLCPEIFKEEIQPLITHKNTFGMKTYGKTLEEIYTEYTTGEDQQENIKLFIKDAIESEGITYVMLVGGMKGQTGEWYVPVRYGHSEYETYLTDLYYADIYKQEDGQLVFEDWDSNNNGRFAEFSEESIDIIDGAPDVYIGRLACRSEKEVTTMINKIIAYESTKAEESWFNHMLLIGGDTYPKYGNYTGCEAEIDTNLSASYMDNFTFNRLWASTGTLTGMSVVENAINDGAGFIHMAGHANPASLVTHPPFNKSEEIVIMEMYNFFKPFHIHPKLTNDDKLPVIVVGGCHNSQFNVNTQNFMKDLFEYGIQKFFFNPPYKYFHMEWVPKCWSWWLTSNPEGGAIAVMGNTGYGMGLPGEQYVTGLDGWLFPRFFYHYGQENKQFVGEAHSLAITDYVNEFDINNLQETADRQMIQQWVLLGDPSLMIGGYET